MFLKSLGPYKKVVENIDLKEYLQNRILEKCNYDVLDSIIYLERRGKVENNETTTIIEVKEKGQEKKEEGKKHEEKFGGIREVIGRIFKFLGKFIKKGNENFFEIRKDNENGKPYQST